MKIAEFEVIGDITAHLTTSGGRYPETGDELLIDLKSYQVVKVQFVAEEEKNHKSSRRYVHIRVVVKETPRG